MARKLVENILEQHQNCSKLPEMARKLVNKISKKCTKPTDFQIALNGEKIGQKSNLYKIARNGEKWS